jgi:hypothetical protein
MTRFNLKGWKFKEWLKGNGKTIKEVLKIGIPIFIGYLITKNPAYITLITAIGKLILDTIEYWIKE